MGVEEEFLLVGPDGALAGSGPEVVDAAEHPQGLLQKELSRSQVESATDVCTGAEELLGQLRRLRADLGAEASSRGLRLLPSAMPPLGQFHSAGITPRPRYTQMAQRFGAVAKWATNCGCHVHVGIDDRELAVQISNQLRPWLPVLLALSANSPFTGGQDTGYSSWRYLQWALWPTAGPPPLFHSLAHYEDTVDALQRVGAAMDRGMVYWDIRLSDKQPTVEIRICDVAATPTEAALLGVVVRGLVARALRDIEQQRQPSSVPGEVLRARVWRAARDGMSGRCPHPITGELLPAKDIPALLVHELQPVWGGEDLKFVHAALRTLSQSGGGADRQRAAHARNHRLTDVIDELVKHAGD
jgi:carboxylate-amine ligase